jgi:hypothetical protein
MTLANGRVDVPAARALREAVAGAMAGLSHSAPEDLVGACSRHTELAVDDTLPDLRATLLDAVGHLSGVPDPASVRLYRHGTGDFTLPRCVGDTVDGGWALIVPLADSATDGITAWTGGRFDRILDEAGTALLLPPNAWTWVSPVRQDHPRYTVMMGVR